MLAFGPIAGTSLAGSDLGSILYAHSLRVSIGSSAVHIKPGSLHIVDVVDQVQTCEFTVEDPHGAYDFSPHQVVIVDEDLITLFRGDCDEAEEVPIVSGYPYNLSGVNTGASVGPREWHIRAVGLSAIAFRNVTPTFSAQARVSVQLVVQTLAANLGLSADVTVSGDPLLPDSFHSDYETYASAFQRLADLATALSGVVHYWKIAWPVSSFGTTQVIFKPTTFSGSGMGVGTGGAKVRANTVKVRKTREQFANTVILKLDKYLKDQRTDTKAGSDIFLGTLKLSYPLAGQPTIKVEDVEETVGIKGIDTGKDWYFNTGSNVLTVGGSSASGDDSIAVEYVPLDLRTVTQQDAGSVGAVGVFAIPLHIGDSGNTIDPASMAAAELARRSALSTVVRCVVFAPGNVFSAGQIVSVNISRAGSTGVTALSGTYYLRSVRHFDEEATIIFRELELISGPAVYTSSQFMSRITR